METSNLPKNKLENSSQILSSASGPIAGIISAVVSHPFDTIKTKQQVHTELKPLTFSKAAMDILKNDGFFGMYRGFSPRAARVVSAISILNYFNNKLTF